MTIRGYIAVLVLAALGPWTAPIARAQPLGAGFTYQGELTEGGVAGEGLYDLRFRLLDAPAGGAQIGPTLCADNTPIAAGRFTTPLDFGAQFAGQRRWLEIAVRRDGGLACGDASGYTVLAPRQELTIAPHAGFALAAGSAAVAATASNATQLGGQGAAFYRDAANLNAGTLADARLAATVARTNTSQTFTGTPSFTAAAPFAVASTARVPNLNADLLDGQSGAFYQDAANLNAGTLADARLSPNIPRLNAVNIFTGGANRFGEVNVDTFDVNNGTFSLGVLRLGVAGSGEGIASNRASDANGNRYGLDFYTLSSRRMSITLGGDVGIGTATPSGQFHTRAGGGEYLPISSLVYTQQIGLLDEAGSAWQSFRARTEGYVHRVYVRISVPSGGGPFTGLVNMTLRQGVGTGGAVLGTGSQAVFFLVGAMELEIDIGTPPAVLVGNDYTVVLSLGAPTNQVGWYISVGGGSDLLPEGVSSVGGTRDFAMGIAIDRGATDALVVTRGGLVGINQPRPRFQLDVAGSVYCQRLLTDSQFITSSARFKRGVGELTGASALAAALRPVRYTRTNLPREAPEIGLIAEEVAAVLPEAVTYEADGVSAAGVSYAQVAVVALAAVREQRAKLTEQENRIAALEAALARLGAAEHRLPRGAGRE